MSLIHNSLLVWDRKLWDIEFCSWSFWWVKDNSLCCRSAKNYTSFCGTSVAFERQRVTFLPELWAISWFPSAGTVSISVLWLNKVTHKTSHHNISTCVYRIRNNKKTVKKLWCTWDPKDSSFKVYQTSSKCRIVAVSKMQDPQINNANRATLPLCLRAKGKSDEINCRTF